MGKHTITKFWLKPESQRKGITDSLLLESGVEIFSAVVDGKYNVFLRTCGDVRIVWKDVSYRNRASFPDDLAEIMDGKYFDIFNDDNVTEEEIVEDFARAFNKGLNSLLQEAVEEVSSILENA